MYKTKQGGQEVVVGFCVANPLTNFVKLSIQINEGIRNMDGIYTNVYSDKTVRLEAFITSLKHTLHFL